MKSLLIAEGDQPVAELFADLFTRDGWTVTTCLDGWDAVGTLRGSTSYDAVLVSNRLRGMGGVELIIRTRALAHRNEIPIVMITGTADVALVAAALAAGAEGVLYKPVDILTLVDTINKCVERSRPQDI